MKKLKSKIVTWGWEGNDREAFHIPVEFALVGLMLADAEKDQYFLSNCWDIINSQEETYLVDFAANDFFNTLEHLYKKQ